MITLHINGSVHHLDIEPDTPLLWAIRDDVGLTGTKFGCGIAQCGCCTVLVDGEPRRSCVTPASAVANAKITTIEGLGDHHPVQEAWLEENVPQCGYCQSGQILSAVALLDRAPHPTDAQIDRAMTNMCRCGSYVEIRRAIHRAAEVHRA